MAETKPVNPTELDQAATAKKIEEAEIADENAAYVNGGDRDAPTDAEAHPS